jgi:leucyl/phenylalanyl-tRNA--protein transferase
VIEIPSSFWLNINELKFPELNQALKEPNGLIGIGGDLSSDRLIHAYSNGIFPWYGNDEPILWYSPNPRMVITPEAFHLSKSLRKTINSSKYTVKVNTVFSDVIIHCQSVYRSGQSGTWINNDMIKAYCNLHDEGYAHSYEVFLDQKLVGGLYGVAMGSVFFGESMFSLVSNASKIAFAYLLQNSDYKLIDCQIENKHLESLGAFNMPRDLFMKQLKAFV